MTMKFIGSIDYKSTLGRKLNCKLAAVRHLGGLSYLNQHCIIEGFQLFNGGNGFQVCVNREFCQASHADQKDSGILAAERIEALCAQ
jgi:hypothetical protein